MMQSRNFSLRTVAIAVAVGSMLAAHAQTWNNMPTGNWSVPGNWTPSGVPAAGADLTFFRLGGLANIVTTNDIGNPFALRSVTFDVRSSGANSMQILSAASNTLHFTGVNPFISFAGTGSAFIGSTVQYTGAIGLSNSSGGNIQINGNIASDGSGPGSLVLSGTPQTYNTSAMLVGSSGAAAQSTMTGGLTLNSGNLSLVGVSAALSTPFGSGALTINGGSVRAINSYILGNNVVLNNTLDYSGSSTLTLNSSGTLSGAGGINLRSQGGGLTVQRASTNSGNVDIGLPSVLVTSTAAGTLTISGTGGSMNNVGSFTVRDGGLLLLSNADTGSTNVSRIGAGASVNLRGGDFRVNSRTTAGGGAFTQNVGSINLEGGANALTVNVSSGADNITMAGAASARTGRGTVLIRASNLGSTAVTGVGRVQLPGFVGSLVGGGGGAGSTNISILPFAVGDTSATGTGTNLVTLDGAGNVRNLAAAEYQSNSFAGVAQNVTISAATAAAGQTVNSLRITGGGVTGTNLNITSGMLLNQTTTASTAGFNFGANEGVVWTTSAMTANGAFTGSNGLTKTGSANLIARADNSGLTGTLTVNQGLVNFLAANQIPGSGTIQGYSAIATAPTSAPGIQLDSTAAVGTVTVSRNINVNKGMFRINSASTNAGVTLDVSGNITGDGGITIDGGFSGPTSFVKLSGNNTFTGPIKHWGGNLEISSDANLGNGGALDMFSDTTFGIRTAGNWTTSRQINFSGTSLVNTNGFNTEWNGYVTAANLAGQFVSTGFLKTGAGDLKIANDSQAILAVSVTGVPTVGVATTTGGTFTVNGIAPGMAVTLGGVNGGGKLRGNGTVGALTFAANGVVAPGTSVGTLAATSVTMVNGSKYEYELGNPLASDLLNVRTTFNGGLTDVIQYDMFALPGIAVGNMYTLATFASTNLLISQFTSAFPLDPGFSGTFEWDNALTPTALRYRIAAVPEPGTFLALGLGIALLAQKRRAKKS